MTHATYDAKQLGAVAIWCTSCGKRWFMTRPAPVCLRCAQRAYYLQAPCDQPLDYVSLDRHRSGVDSPSM